MNRPNRIIAIMLAAAPVLFSCGREEHAELGEGGSFRLTVAIADGSREVKTALGEESGGRYPVVWSTGDRISVGGVVSEPLDAGHSGSTRAEFEFPDEISSPFNILYPASEQEDQVEFLSEQPYSEGSFSAGAVPMYASTRSYSDVSMKHLSSVIRFAFTGDVPIKTIRVSSQDARPLAGTFVLEKDGEGMFTGEMTPKGGNPTAVILSFAEPQELGPEVKYFYAAVPKGDYPSGFAAQIIAGNGASMALNFHAGETPALPGGKLLRLTPVEFSSESTVFLIATVEDFLTFAAAASSYPYAVLTADIDLAGADFTSISGFTGILDGSSFSISGLSKPLFSTLGGKVQNLVLKVDATVTPGNRYGAFADTVAEGASIENCSLEGEVRCAFSSPEADIYVGGATAINKGRITGFVNKAAIESVDAVNTTVKLYMGGVAALQNSVNARITRCRNEGTVKSASHTNNPYLAGILANLTEGELDNVENAGDVLFPEDASTSANLYAGGVAASVEAPATALVNSGKVKVLGTSSASGTAYFFCGGVVGNASASLSNLTHDGEFEFAPYASGAATSYAGGVTGRAHCEGGIYSALVAGSQASSDFRCMEGSSGPSLCSYGGVIGGITAKDVSILDCTNSSAVSIRGGGARNQLFAGGIFGTFNVGGAQEITLARLENHGALSFNGLSLYGTTLSERNCFGGIGGRVYATSTSTLSVTDCKNAGPVELTLDNDSQRTFAGGLLGQVMIYSAQLDGCSNEGNVTVRGTCSHIGIGGIVGLALRDENEETLVINRARNSGKLGLYEDGKCSNPSYAGGIVALALSGPVSTGKMLTLTLDGCVNTGDIDRLVTNYISATESRNYAGGIVGNMGYDTSTSTTYKRNYITADIVRCTNSGQIIFNQYVGPDRAVETAYAWTYTGGIVGLSACNGGRASIKCCTNSGNILSTSGTHGGIIGSAFSATEIVGEKTASGIEWTKNTGMVMLPVAEDYTLGGLGHACVGGIAGELRRTGNLSGLTGQSVLRIEYCWNDGYVGGCSENAAYGVGGIVGRQYWGGTTEVRVLHCKNSGSVKALNSPSGANTAYNGAIAGILKLDNVNRTVSDCAVGGRLARGGISAGQWFVLEPLGGTRAFNKYIYSTSVDENSMADLAPGCVYWDGREVLDWEK